MIQYFKNIFASLDNKINPIAVKEMRQAVRSRYITLLLQLYLLIELLMTGFYLLTFDTNNLTTGGSELFLPLIFLLFIANLVCVPVYTSNRLAREIRDNDAMFSTTLTPMQIVRGKFFCGLIISLLLFSAAAPFVILTYLLRGLDISQILSTLYWTFLIVQVLNCYGIVFGALNINNVLRAILGCIMGFAIVGLLDSMPLSFSLISAVSSMDWEAFFIVTLVLLFLGEAFIMLAACLLSPITFNRMTRPRIFATVSSFSLMIIAIIYNIFSTSDDYIETALAFSFFISLIFLGIGLCERTKLSVRQIQQIPRSPLLRVFAFPFFTGVGSAVVWFILMFDIVILYDIGFNQGDIFDNFLSMKFPFPFLCMILFYSTCGMLIRIGIDAWRRNNASQRVPEDHRIVIYPAPQKGIATVAYTFFLIAIPSLIPLLFVFSHGSDLREALFYFSPFNYLETYRSKEVFIPVFFGIVSAGVLIIYSVISFLNYFKASLPKISRFYDREGYKTNTTENQQAS
ncbi:MAG: hypothetical protein IKW80_09690 [Thermoguttaceae bacterium]|nr:hypothetical protein [Thermoguttaceae bacterium]